MFAGICRVHRAQLMQVDGRWSEAEHEATLVSTELARLNVAAVAEGHYQVGEIRRLRGDAAGAEEAYKRAHQFGRSPQPGLALVWLAQGRPEAAAAAIRTALAEQVPGRLERARLCAAYVEACLAVGDVDAADAAAVELGEIAARYVSPGFAAAAAQASGMVQLARGQAGGALPALRRACRSWLDLDAPYETARVRMLLAQAYLALGDADAATLELDAATAALAALGAAVDIRRADQLRGTPGLPAGLTAREAEVLARVAAGGSNRDIATALFISEKTVARHLSNIFDKLGVSSRTEAAAFAFTHGLTAR
jgi:DNA-binding CsgD family transcriptional regulator